MEYMGYKSPPYIEPVAELQHLFWPALKPSQGALGQPPGISKMRTFGSVLLGLANYISASKKEGTTTVVGGPLIASYKWSYSYNCYPPGN